jgi:ankyrin repeat protein
LEENRYLAYAARLNFVRVVKTLVELGIDPNLRARGRTALGHAKISGFTELIDLLEPLASSNGKSKRKKRKTEL